MKVCELEFGDFTDFKTKSQPYDVNTHLIQTKTLSVLSWVIVAKKQHTFFLFLWQLH